MDEQAKAMPVYYSNGITLNVSPYDMVLSFALNIPGGNGAGGGPQCAVILSPHHAKTLAKMLADAVARHEADYGQMKVAVPQLADTATRPADL